MRQLKKLMFGLIFVAVIGFFAYTMIFGEKIEHIEDTNGPDNYSLATITEADVIACEMGSKGGPNTTTKKTSFAGITFSNGVEYEAKQFTGVYELASGYIYEGSTWWITFYDFQVTAGNFRMYVIADDKIVGTVEPSAEAIFETEVETSAWYRVVIAGESAAFSFKTNEIDPETRTFR